MPKERSQRGHPLEPFKDEPEFAACHRARFFKIEAVRIEIRGTQERCTVIHNAELGVATFCSAHIDSMSRERFEALPFTPEGIQVNFVQFLRQAALECPFI
jgi:hypothetical protein